MMRRKTKIIKIGNVKIGKGFLVAIQGMTKTKTSQVKKCISEIKSLHNCGADIIRIAIDDLAAAEAFKKIRKAVPCVPLVADIHFDYRLAIKALEYGVDKIRLNPGNLTKDEEIRKVVCLARKLKKPVRVGVNSGSVKREKGLNAVDSMVKAAINYSKKLEKMNFRNIVLSLKSSDLVETIDANRKIAKMVKYPLHLGVTATGLGMESIIKSAMGIGSLLLDGIGDTIRVSLTDNSLKEVEIAKKILVSAGLRNPGIEIISCPTCGRCSVDLRKIVQEFEKMLQTKGFVSYNKKTSCKIAIMGCVVNGPGEAKEADFGIAFSKKRAAIFKKGKIVTTVEKRFAKPLFTKLLREEMK